MISRACYVEPASPLYGSRVVNFVHDEFVLECPEERAAEAAEELGRLAALGARPFLPDVKMEVEPLLCRRWNKRAKQKRGADGRLVPWEDAA
jgi:DNA polymerase I-like protein with 3'-5' exonuclease and polymerase domains